MSRFNTPTKSNRTTNAAGGKAFIMSPETELIHAVLTTFLEDKYYESGSDRAQRIANLVAANKPEFVANLAVIARKEFNLRSVVTLLIGELAKNHRGDNLVSETIKKACIRVDDLTELVAYLGKPLPKQVKKGIRNALLKFDRYQLAKYKNEGKGVSLVDVFNLVHPRVSLASDEQKQAWADLINGKLVSRGTWESEISNAGGEAERAATWEKLVADNKLGYMALLRNLNNLLKYNVSPETLQTAIAKLTDPKEVKYSKQLPFRFVTAYKNVAGNRRLSDAISEAMDIAVANTPELPGRTLIAIDSSGSMSGEPMQKASIFGATLAKSNPDADVILYDTNVKELTLNSRVPVVDLAQKIESMAMGGGTMTALTFAYAIQKNRQYDRFIIISDNESWAERSYYSNSSVQKAYNSYKQTTGTDPFIYAIDIQGYGTKDLESGKVFHMTGWSNRLLDFIANAEKGDSLVAYVREYSKV